MKFSEIKDKIQNLGDFKSLAEVKAAGLRVVRNTKTGDYWLIENEFLKSVIKSPRECESILVKPEELKYKVFVCHGSKGELERTRALGYIKWGEGKQFNKRPTCKSRSRWWDLGLTKHSQALCMMSYNDRHIFWKNNKFLVDARFYDIFSEISEDKLVASLNTTLSFVFVELNGRINLGEGALDFKVYEAEEIGILNPELLDTVGFEDSLQPILHRPIGSVFEECGLDPSKPIRPQEPKPLPDRKALDDVVFDALGLTEQERKEVYWAVCELVKNRLEKAKSV